MARTRTWRRAVFRARANGDLRYRASAVSKSPLGKRRWSGSQVPVNTSSSRSAHRTVSVISAEHAGNLCLIASASVSGADGDDLRDLCTIHPVPSGFRTFSSVRMPRSRSNKRRWPGRMVSRSANCCVVQRSPDWGAHPSRSNALSIKAALRASSFGITSA